MVVRATENDDEVRRLIASAAHLAQVARLGTYADSPRVAVRRGDGWFAVRTGAHSNDMNGVVTTGRAEVTKALVDELTAWFAQAPASWLTAEPDAHLTGLLLGVGAHPERTGSWSGREMPTGTAPLGREVTITAVRSPEQLEVWLGIATTCGWIENRNDRELRGSLYGSLMRPGAPLTHWLALDGVEPVGFASSYVHDRVVDLCNLAVVPSRRRQGIGRALVAARLEDAAARGATMIVSAPSPDGWAMQRALGFRSVSVIPDTCFYLPS